MAVDHLEAGCATHRLPDRLVGSKRFSRPLDAVPLVAQCRPRPRRACASVGAAAQGTPVQLIACAGAAADQAASSMAARPRQYKALAEASCIEGQTVVRPLQAERQIGPRRPCRITSRPSIAGPRTIGLGAGHGPFLAGQPRPSDHSASRPAETRVNGLASALNTKSDAVRLIDRPARTSLAAQTARLV